MNFHDMCKQAIENGKPAKLIDETSLPWELASQKEKNRRVDIMFSDIAIKNSTKETFKSLRERGL
ncbi:hypothetical protein OAA60_00880 [Porticoccaceae bacterium]|nr:hypothetical protein [Porticoccaceae bacterium]